MVKDAPLRVSETNEVLKVKNHGTGDVEIVDDHVDDPENETNSSKSEGEGGDDKPKIYKKKTVI